MEISQAFKNFIGGLRDLMSDIPEHRFQDQFIDIRNDALNLADSEEMAGDLNSAYKKETGNPNNRFKKVVDIVVDELKSYANAVSVWRGEVKANIAKSEAKSMLIATAKTIIDSLKDVLASLTPFGKGVLTVLKEALDFFS